MFYLEDKCHTEKQQWLQNLSSAIESNNNIQKKKEYRNSFELCQYPLESFQLITLLFPSPAQKLFSLRSR